MLIHASERNRDAMPASLRMFRNRGYAFVSLAAALRDPSYRGPDDYAGLNSPSWISRWAFTRHMRPKDAPGQPNFIRQEYQREQASRK